MEQGILFPVKSNCKLGALPRMAQPQEIFCFSVDGNGTTTFGKKNKLVQ
jgi:hypothetical protein